MTVSLLLPRKYKLTHPPRLDFPPNSGSFKDGVSYGDPAGIVRDRMDWHLKNRVNHDAERQWLGVRCQIENALLLSRSPMTMNHVLVRLNERLVQLGFEYRMPTR